MTRPGMHDKMKSCLALQYTLLMIKDRYWDYQVSNEMTGNNHVIPNRRCPEVTPMGSSYVRVKNQMLKLGHMAYPDFIFCILKAKLPLTFSKLLIKQTWRGYVAYILYIYIYHFGLIIKAC